MNASTPKIVVAAVGSEARRQWDAELKRRLRLGLAAIALIGLGGIGWANVATLSNAVIAEGRVVVEGDVRKVQHPTGGVVGAIHVRNGDKVAAGDVLVSLDETQTRATLDIVRSQLAELEGRIHRLTAERDNLAAMPDTAPGEVVDEELRRVLEGETRLFTARRATSEGQKAQLRERISQLGREVEGLTAQHAAKERELKLVREELARVADMQKRQLLPVTRLLAMQREETRIAGEHGALAAQIAQAQGRISEIELQILSIDQARQADAQKELRDVEARIAELRERKIAAEDQLRRIDLKAPVSGIVHQLSAHTIGGVIGSGEPVMLIVPSQEALSVEVHIQPGDIDQVTVGQTTVLRFPAFDQRTTPEIEGTLTTVAADQTREQTGLSYYTARVALSPSSLDKLGSLKLVPGMPVEAFIESGRRTALSYFFKPVADQFARAFREQ